MPLLSRIRTLLREEPSVVDEHTSSQPLNRLPGTPRPKVGSSPTLPSSGISLSQRYAQMAQDLRLSMPFTCPWLDPRDIKLVGKHQIGAGGFADIWEATHDGRKVVLKSYRCYVSFDAAQVVARFYNETHVHSLLHRGDVDVVPLVGVYSTEQHPFGLIYEYMEGLDLKQYLRNEPSMERLKLLIGIVRCLERMHGLDIVHEDIQTANILVDNDGTPRIAGLGNAFILPNSATRTVGGRISTNRFSHSCAPEFAGPETNPIHRTKASDMYAFGVMTFEVLTGRPSFFEMPEIAATCSMHRGNRPLRPNHHEITDPLWDMIERCWHNKPSERMSAREALSLLEAESRRMSNSTNGPAPGNRPT